MARRVIEGQVGMFDAGIMEPREVQRPGPHPTPPKAGPPSPKGEGLGGRETPARVLTLAEIENLEPFRAVVWIETLDDGPGATTNPARAFLRLFEAVFQTIGIPIGSERKHYHFKYTYTDGRNYYHHRMDEFYGRDWRVWDKKPTDKQRGEAPWLGGKNSAE